MRSIDFTDSVNAAIQGNMNAFEFLYNQTYYHLRLTIAKYLKKEADIEDVLQNTYLKIYSELPNLKEPKTFWKWAGDDCDQRRFDRNTASESPEKFHGGLNAAHEGFL